MTCWLACVAVCLGTAPGGLQAVDTIGPALPDGSRLVEPVDVAVSPSAEVYLLDRARKLVLWFDAVGNPKGEFGGFGWDEGEMWEPTSLALSPLGIYVTDSDREALLKFDHQGAFVRRISLADLVPEMPLPLRPWGVSVGPGGEVFVTESSNGFVLRLDFSDRIDTSFGVFGRGLTHMDEPRGLVVSNERRIYLCDGGNRRLQVLDALGNVMYDWQLPDQGEPWDVAVDAWGYCYVSVPSQHRLLVFDPSGHLLQSWKPDGPVGSRSFSPLGVALGPRDRLYVADEGNAALLVLSILRSKEK